MYFQSFCMSTGNAQHLMWLQLFEPLSEPSLLAFAKMTGLLIVYLFSYTSFYTSVRILYLFHLSFKGAQWRSGRVLDSRPKGRGFEPHRRHCVVSLSKINPSLVLVQPRKTRPFITEILLMGRKESNQTNHLSFWLIVFLSIDDQGRLRRAFAVRRKLTV